MFASLLNAAFDIGSFSKSLGNNSPAWVSGFIILIGFIIILQGAWDFHKGLSGQGGSGKFLGLGFAAIIIGGTLALKSSVEALQGFGDGTAQSIKQMGQGNGQGLVASYFPTVTALPLSSLVHLL